MAYSGSFGPRWRRREWDRGATFSMLERASSLCFILRGDFDSTTEVTATEDGTYGAKKLRKAVRGVDTIDIVVGNWKDSAFLVDEKYDVVVADYLGAVEMLWPHGADGMIDRCCRYEAGGFI